MRAKVLVSKDNKIIVPADVINKLGLQLGEIVELEIARQSPKTPIGRRAEREALLREWIFNDDPEGDSM